MHSYLRRTGVRRAEQPAIGTDFFQETHREAFESTSIALLYCVPAVNKIAAGRVMALKIDDAINVEPASCDTTP